MPLSFDVDADGHFVIASHPPETPPLPQFHEELTPLAPEEFVAEGDSVRQAGTLGEETKMISLYRRRMEQSLFVFNYTIMGGDNILQKVPHGVFCDFLQAVPPKRKLLLAPRGHLKTTLAGGLALHFFIQPRGSNQYFPRGLGALNHNDGRSTRILMSSKSLQHASDRLGFIRTRLEMNKLFYGFWPHIFWENPTKHARVWNSEELLLQRDDIFVEPSIKAIGVGGQITGYHFNVHLHDDIIDIKDRFSAQTMKTAFDWFVASRALMDNIQESLEITTGTHWANNDVYTLLRENDRSIETRVYSALIRGSVSKDPGHNVTLTDDAAPLWPQVFPLNLIEQLAQPEPYGVGDLFPLCYLNDPYHSSVVDFSPKELRFYTIQDGQFVLFEEDSRDYALKQVFAQPGIPEHLVQGMKFNQEGYEALRERLRDRPSKIVFNGR